MVKNITLFSLCLLVFIDSIGIGIIYTIVPQLFLDPINGLIPESCDIPRNVLYGLTFALFSLTSFVGIPTLSTLSDTYGRKRLMLIALLGIATAHILSIAAILTHNPITFLISRATEGFFSGTYVIANAFVGDISVSSKKKADNFRLITFSVVAGFALGPFLGTIGDFLPSEYSLIFPFVISLFLAIVNGVLLFFVIEENLSLERKSRDLILCTLKKSIFIFDNIGNRSLKFLISGYGLFQFSFGLFLPFIGLFLAKRYSYSSGNIGLFFISMGASIAISISIFQPIINKHINYQLQLRFGLLLMSIILLMQDVILVISNELNLNSLPYLWISSAVFFAVLPLMNTNFMTLFSELSYPENQGAMMGKIGQISSMTAFLSGIMMGYLFNVNEIIIFAVSGIGFFSSYYFLNMHKKFLPTSY